MADFSDLTGLLAKVAPIAGRVMEAGAGFGSPDYPRMVEERMARRKRHQQMVEFARANGVPEELIAKLPEEATMQDVLPQQHITPQGQVITAQPFGGPVSATPIAGFQTPKPKAPKSLTEAGIQLATDPNNPQFQAEYKAAQEAEDFKASLRRKYHVAAAGAGGQQGTESDAAMVAQAIINGDQPPTLTGLYRNNLKVRAELERQGFDLATAQRDWAAIQKHLASLNGQQQLRLRQAITFTHESIPIIESLYAEWKQLGGPSGYRIFNRINLEKSKQEKGRLGEVAQGLETQIADVISELATVYKGGNSSTNESLKLAAKNLGSSWNEGTFKRAIGLMKRNLQIRYNSIATSAPMGVSPGSPYLPKTPGVVSSGGAAPIKVRRKADGVVGTIDSEDEFDPNIYEKVP